MLRVFTGVGNNMGVAVRSCRNFGGAVGVVGVGSHTVVVGGKGQLQVGLHS
uniref:Uncharacterized protein n=1 Tax=Ciona intestinalis TaxID=7719 RepID=H2XNR0_CIOIN